MIRENTLKTRAWTGAENLGRDVRYALRMAGKSLGFTLTAVLTLGIGIGAASAIFGLMDALWLHPLEVPNAGRLVRVFATTRENTEELFSYFEYESLAHQMPALSGLAVAGGRGSLMPRSDGTSRLLLTNVVSANFFEVLGVRAKLGRLFGAADSARLRVHPAIVLGYRCWQRDFHGDPSIVGKFAPLRRGAAQIYQVEILGVLPESFREIDANSDQDLWMPAEVWSANVDASELISHSFRWFRTIGRLSAEASVAQANQEAANVALALQKADPANNRNRGARVLSDFTCRMNRAGSTSVLLFAIVAGVVLLSTLNVAHLLVARSVTRTPEIALRLSLGATRWAVARQLLMENLLLGLMAWVVGLAIASGLAGLLPHLLVSGPVLLDTPSAGAILNLDWRFAGVAGGLALSIALLLAPAPLLQAARSEPGTALQQSQGGRIIGGLRARRGAVCLQVAISFALLVAMGALVRSFLNTQTRPIGLTRSQVLIAFTQNPDGDGTLPKVLSKLSALPGVREVAYGIRSPLMPSEGGIAVKASLPNHAELREPLSIRFNAISPGFLRVTGTQIRKGRAFTAFDDRPGPMTVIVNRTLADRYFKSSEAIGQAIRIQSSDGAMIEARIVGISEDAPIEQLGESAEPFLYVPFQQYLSKLGNMGEITFTLSTAANAMSLGQAARQALIDVNPLLDPMFVTSQPELLRYSARNYQMMAELVTALGGIGLLLTVVGLYGFLSFVVAQRRREIGIRMAVGATRQTVAALVLRDTGRTAVAGLAIGFILSCAVIPLEQATLFGVEPLDGESIAIAFGVLVVAVLGAAWLPTRRAASVEPMEVLRCE